MIPDNYSQWQAHDRRQEALLGKLPYCEDPYCGKQIQDDYYFEVEGFILCEDCMNSRYRKNTEDFVNN